MTDSDFLASVLADGEWHSHNDILESSFHQRGHGLTVHSRASDLRKRGHIVEVHLRSTGGRTVSFYRLSSLNEPSVDRRAASADLFGVAEGSLSVPATDGANESADTLPADPGTLPLFEDAA